MLGAILGAVAGEISDLVNTSGLSSKDQARVQAASNALTKALAGDQSQLAYMIQQSQNSATQVGKNAFQAALQKYYAAQAGAAATNGAASTTIPVPASAQTALQAQLAATANAVKTDVANGVQNIGAGSTTAAVSAITGNNSAVTIPTNMTTILIIGGAVLGLILILGKHK